MSSEAATCGQSDAPNRRDRRRQTETPIPGQPGLRLAVYPSGRRTFILRYRDPVTGKKTAMTLGVAE